MTRARNPLWPRFHWSLLPALLAALLAASSPGAPFAQEARGEGQADDAAQSIAGHVQAALDHPVGEAAPAPAENAHIVVAGREIYQMKAPLGGFTAKERAKGASERIRALVKAPRFDPAEIQATESEGLIRIVFGERVLFTVLHSDLSEEDAAAPLLAARRVAGELASAIELDRISRTPRRVLTALGLTMLLLAVVGVLGWAVVRVSGRARRKILTWKGTVLRGIHLRGLELISPDAMVNGAGKMVGLLTAGAFLLLAYLAVSGILALFPWTQPYGRASGKFIFEAVYGVVRAIIGFIPNLFMIVLTIVVIRYINRFVGFIFDAVERGVPIIPGLHPKLAAPTKQLARWLVWILGMVVIFPYLPGSGSAAFQGVGVFVGLMVSLGSSGAIGNLVAGIVLTYSRSFSVGDRVKIADTMGDVVSTGLLSTKIMTIKNEEVTIPNAGILGNHIVNYTELSQSHGLILHTSVTIGYDAPWTIVHELLISAARGTRGILQEPAPFVFQRSLDDFYVNYEINAYTHEPQRMAAIYSDLHQNIQDRFNAGGVEILSPHYRALRDGNEVTIPAGERKPGYGAPAFRVQSIAKDQGTRS